MYGLNDIDLDKSEHHYIESGNPSLPKNFYVNDDVNAEVALKDCYYALGTGRYDVAVWNGLAQNIAEEQLRLWQIFTTYADTDYKDLRRVPRTHLYKKLKEGFNALAAKGCFPITSLADFLSPLDTIIAAKDANWLKQHNTYRCDIGVSVPKSRFIHTDGWVDSNYEHCERPEFKYEARTLTTLSGRGTFYFDRSELITPDSSISPYEAYRCKILDCYAFKIFSPTIWETKPFALSMFAGNGSDLMIPLHAIPFETKAMPVSGKRSLLFGNIQPKFIL